MSFEFNFRTDTDLSAGLEKLIDALEVRLEPEDPIKMYIAGGMAAHLYTGMKRPQQKTPQNALNRA